MHISWHASRGGVKAVRVLLIAVGRIILIAVHIVRRAAHIIIGTRSKSADGLAVDTTIVPTEEALQVLSERVTEAEADIAAMEPKVAEAITMTTVATQPDPSVLQPGEGQLYPAEDLL